MKTVILVRHADIDIPPTVVSDALLPLNAAGRSRAEALARVAGAAGVTAVFTSHALRAKQTATPLAAVLGLQPALTPDSPVAFADTVMSEATGPTVLVVGHSTTVPPMIAALGAIFPGPPIQEYDDMFVVTVADPERAAIVRLKYGAGPVPSTETRVAVEVEGVSLDLPSHIPQSALLQNGGSRTPFAWNYNYLALRLLPRTVWVNGVSYGAVRPGDQVRLETSGQVIVNCQKRTADSLLPVANEPSPEESPIVPTFTDLAGVTSRGTAVEFRGQLFAGKPKPQKAVSGGDGIGEVLLLVSDEMKDPTVVQVLKQDGDGYAAAGLVKLPAGDDEVDLEAVGVDLATRTVYVTGAHARTRKVEDGVIGEVKRKESREQFFRFKLKPDGTPGPVEGPKTLSPAIEADPVLKHFAGVASKENGIDIEGLAVKDGRLHFGFRGPVLRGGWVPVLSCTWDDPAGTAKVDYLRLDGRGIRDLAAVDGGFLVLAGPVGDGDFSYRIYFWDGADQLSAEEEVPGLQQLGEFSGLGEGKPEGLVVLKDEGGTYDVLVLCDGLPKGGPVRWKMTRA